MASHLSEEEFQRLQAQLIDLRTSNYSHEERARKYCKEIEDLRIRLDGSERERDKAQRILSRSKKARDVELLLNDNECLQMKLQNQEDEFRLQNQTLLNELSSLVSANEKLEREVAGLRRDGRGEQVGEEESRRLQARVTALEKCLEEVREKGREEAASLRLALAELAEVNQELQRKVNCGKGAVVGSGGEAISGDLGTPSDDGDFVQVGESEVSYRRQSMSTLEALRQAEDQLSSLSKEVSRMEDLKLELSAEREEKRVLSCQLESLSSQSELLKAKLERKQESVMSLQEEKERAFEEVQEARKRVEELEAVVESGREAVRGGEEAIRREAEATARLREKEAESQALQGKVQTLLKDLGDIQATADQRRSVLEKMSESLQRTNEEHASRCRRLESELAKAQAELMDLLRLPAEVARLEAELARSESTNQELVARIEDIRCELDDRQREHEEELDRCRLELQNAQEDFYDREQDLKTEIELVQAQRSEFEEAARALRQEVRDSLEERRLHERKGASILKDLKRQLQAERKRGEKLQETLKDVLSKGVGVGVGVASGVGMTAADNDACSISSWSLMSGNADHKDGSFSTGSPSTVNGNHSPSMEELDLEQENFNLLSRITSLQQDKWGMEERINHLEQSNAAMAEDIMQKSALIQFYCIDGRAGVPPSPHSERLTVRRLVEFVKKAGDESVREANQKLQRMLEDTLTKNMHLQKELENLSSEVVRLSKVNAGQPS